MDRNAWKVLHLSYLKAKHQHGIEVDLRNNKEQCPRSMQLRDVHCALRMASDNAAFTFQVNITRKLLHEALFYLVLRGDFPYPVKTILQK